MTDHQEPSSEFYNVVQNESAKYGDMRFQNLGGGIQFGVRYLYHAIFAMKHYDFDYFLRMDDDYFFCLDNFLQEIPQPMEKHFHWGWVHCIESITRPEESMILFSRDLLTKYLKQDPQKMKCHPWADQMIGEWTNDLKLLPIFRHDDRIHHVPIVSEEPSLRDERSICSKYIAIHGCYPPDMRLFWRQRGSNTGHSNNVKQNLKSNSHMCMYSKKFDWRIFIEEWKYEPKLCIGNPQWDTKKQSTTGGSYTGRQNS